MREGWKIEAIGDVCTLSTGGTPRRTEKDYFDGGEIKWLVSGDIHKKEIVDCDGRISQLGLENSNAKYLPKNSVMIALNGQGKTRGTVALLRTEATCNQSLVSIMPNDPKNLLPEYVFANLHGRYDEIRKLTGDGGNDRRGLNMPLIRKIEIPIAPLAEQKRIVDLLDEAFAGIAVALAAASKNLKNARELFETTLNTTFTQKGEGWVETTLLDAVEENCSLSYGIVQPGNDFPDGLPVVRPTDLKTKTIKVSGLKLIDPSLAQSYLRTKLFGGELLLCVRGSTGTLSIASKELTGANVTRGIVPIRFDAQKMDQEFGYFQLIARPFQDQIRAGTYGAALMQINIRDLKKISVFVPSSVEQADIVGRLSTLSTQTQHLESLYQQKIDALNELKQSLLQKAFAGELTAEAQPLEATG